MGDVLLKRQWSFSGKLTRLILVGGKPGQVKAHSKFKAEVYILTKVLIHRKTLIWVLKSYDFVLTFGLLYVMIFMM